MSHIRYISVLFCSICRASKYGAKVPCIIVVKRDDPLEPFKHTAARDVMAEEITTFTSIARLPVFVSQTCMVSDQHFLALKR